MKPSINQRWTPLQFVPLHADHPARKTKDLSRHDEMYRNSTHTVLVYPNNASEGLADPMDGWVTLSIKRNDRKAECDWRIFMRIKNEIVGPEREAFQLFPCMERVVDTANQYFLFVVPKGYVIQAGQMEQEVSDSERANPMGAVQRDFEGDDPLALMVNNITRSTHADCFPLPLYPQGMLRVTQHSKGTWRWIPDAPEESSDGKSG
jgi:hypothetical protein